MKLNLNDPLLIAILRGIKPEEVIKHVDILVEEGYKIIEVPTNSPNWSDSVRLLTERYPELLIGVGTVVKKEFLPEIARVGAKIIVTPNTDTEIISLAKKEYDLIVCSGFFTPSEAFQAIKAGADILKLFPANICKIEYLKSLSAVLPQNIPVLAVGGVNIQNMHDYYRTGFTGFGLGSDLYKAGQSLEQTKIKSHDLITVWKNLTRE